MLYPIAGYTTTDSSSQQFNHITYVGTDGHLHDLVAPNGGTWKYNLDITAAANATVQALNTAFPSRGFTSIPNARGNVGVYVTQDSGAGGTPQIFYYGTDSLIHVIFPVGLGFFWPGKPETPPDVDLGEGFGGAPPEDNPDPGGEPNPGAPPSPPGWADTWVISTPGGAGVPTSPPLAIYAATPDGGNVTVIFSGAPGGFAGDLGGVKGAMVSWSAPSDISALAGEPSVGPDASAIYWDDDGTEHVFSVNQEGLLKELWSRWSADTVTWGAHDVLHEVKDLTPTLHPGTNIPHPLAPNALSPSVTASYVLGDGSGAGSSKNVAYIPADTDVHNVYLCSHKLGGNWAITYASAVAISAPPQSKPGLEYAPLATPPSLSAYVSDRQHILFNDVTGTVIDLWTDPSGNWHFGLASTELDVQFQGAAPVNAATGMFAFVADGSDHVVFIGDDGHIWELSLPQGSSELPGPASKGLPWAPFDVTAAVQSNPSYVPPVMG